MAYTAVLTKESVTQQSNGIYHVSIRAVVNDGSTDVFDRVFSTKHSPERSDLSEAKADLQQQFVEAWNEYVDNEQLRTSTALDTALSELQTAANNYVNQ